MKMKLEKVTPEMARELLKHNTHNRRVRQSHVDYLASEIAGGRWQTTPNAIAFASDKTVIDGQHRLLAIVQAGVAVESWMHYDTAKDVQDVLDLGTVRTIADQLQLNDGAQSAVIRAGAARTIVQMCCGYQTLKLSVGMARMVLSEFDREIGVCIEHTRGFRPGHKTWVIGALAFALSADRNTLKFIEDFGSGEGLTRGNPAKAARDWLTNRTSAYLTQNYKRGAIESLLNAAYNGVMAGSITQVKSGVQGFEYFAGKRRKTVLTIRDQMKQQIVVGEERKAA